MTAADPVGAARVTAFAPAKINLTLHVTGRRPDGYHLLDSLVVFADLGDRLTVSLADAPALSVKGPLAAGVPSDGRNLALRAAAFHGTPAHIVLDKTLPAEAGIGGGSSDAAAVLRALTRLTGRPVPPGAEVLGADVPVCLAARAARMRGLGEAVETVPALPMLHAVLVNPGVPVATPAVFAALARRDNPPMPEVLPRFRDSAALTDWLAGQRNDMQAAAEGIAPQITSALAALGACQGCRLARMSGSGATCFGLFASPAAAQIAADDLAARHPGWWVRPTGLA